MMKQSAPMNSIGSDYWDRSAPTGVWRRYLSRASSDGAGLKRWQFWIWWSRPRSPSERLIALQTLLTKPWDVASSAYRLVKVSGRRLEQAHGVSPAQQYRAMLRLWANTGLPPAAYYKYQLYLPERRVQADDYIEEATRLLQVILRRIRPSPDDAIFTDKRAFEEWCQTSRLPAVTTLLEFSEGRVTRRAVKSLPAQSLFSKPTNLRAGMGVCLWRHEARDGHSVWSGGEERNLTAGDLEARLALRSEQQKRPFVLQPCLTNHPAIAGLGNGALSTVRLMTVRLAPDKPARPLLAVLRIPVGDSVADNFDAGGIAIPIDLETGECGEAVRKRGEYPLQPVAQHPDTGAQLKGAILPFWHDSIALATRAHDLLTSHMPVIGWDIALLSEGPILIESNHLPCGNLAQMPGGIPLGSTPYADCVIHHLRKAFL